MEGWRKQLKEELRDLCSSPSIITIIKSSRMRCTGHVAQMGRRGPQMRYCKRDRRKEITRQTKKQVGK
jgi:hypothetical protein